MLTTLDAYAADHRKVIATVAKEVGFADPVAIVLHDFNEPLMKVSRKGRFIPFHGVFIRDWDPDNRSWWPGLYVGARAYHLDGMTFVRVKCGVSDDLTSYTGDFTLVDRKEYFRLYKRAVQARRDSEPPGLPPILPAEVSHTLWQNTIGYLDRNNLRRIKQYGGRPKRGILLSGPPGNGKTSACRWLWQECRHRRWNWKLVTPDEYTSARRSNNAVEAVKELFKVDKRGIVFFDDMDIALRDRDTVRETDDQAVFLSALDGIEANEGVVYVFTTNCPLNLIDPAFRRPGRIDLLLHFPLPDADLRRKLASRWHADILAALDMERLARDTDGMSYAEVEELKNLLVLRFVEVGRWEWAWAVEQFKENRSGLVGRKRGAVGFAALAATANGTH